MNLALLVRNITGDDIGKIGLFEIDGNKLRKRSAGDILDCTVKVDRRYNKLQSYWACCELVAQNAKKARYENLELDSRDKVDYYSRVKTGMVDMVIVTDKETIVRAKSLSYDKMSEEDFEDYFYGKAVPLWEEITGIAGSDILTNFPLYQKGGRR